MLAYLSLLSNAMRCLLFLVCLLYTMSIQAQHHYSSTIIDSENGEPLPFAKVIFGKGLGTTTNMEGKFQIYAMPSDTLHISCIGYEEVAIVAAELKHIVHLKIMSKMMNELVVQPTIPLLVRISKKLYKEYRKNKYRKGLYFYRERHAYSDGPKMMEAFMEASSCVNLRELQMLTCQRFDSLYNPGNLWGFSQVGVMTNDVFPMKKSRLISPLAKNASQTYYDKYYNIEYQTLRSDNVRVMMITFTNKCEDILQPIIVGNLFVDPNTLQPLAFRGRIENVQIWTEHKRQFYLQKCMVQLRINYQTINGFTEVRDISTFSYMGFGNKDWVSMYRCNGYELPNFYFRAYPMKKKVLMREPIEATGYDSVFWARHEIVPRTAAEDSIVQAYKKMEYK